MMNPILIDKLVRERERDRVAIAEQRPRRRSWRRARRAERPDTGAA